MTIAQLLKQHAYQTGEFTLSSGQTTTEYLDIRRAVLNHQVMPHLMHGLLSLAGPPWECKYQAIAGVVLGGALLASHMGIRRARPVLVIRQAAKQHGLKLSIEGLANLPDDKLQPIILVDDVITTGASTIQAMAAIKEVGHLEVISILAVVDRQAGGLERLKAEYPGCQVAALTTLKEIREAKV